MLGLDNVHFYVHRIYSSSTAAAAVYLLSSILSRASKRIYVVTFCILFFRTWMMINKQTSGSLEMCKKGKTNLNSYKKSFNPSVRKFIHLQIIFVLCQSLTRLTISIFILIFLTSFFLSLVIRLLFYDLQPTGVTTHIVYHLASLHITKHQILLLYYLDNLIPPQLNILHLT